MKSTKSAKLKPAASANEEECGIWLDTKELKEKKQQKQLSRPISTLLNPLARTAGYRVASFGFSQTKLKLPVTTQSTIAAFFSPKSRDCNPSAPRAGISHAGAKRKHGMTSDPSIKTMVQTSEENQQNCEPKEQRFLRLIRGDEPEEPPEKRRHVAHHTDKQNDLETQDYWRKPAPNEYPYESETFLCRQSQNHRPLTVRKPSGETREHFLQSPGPKTTDQQVSRDQKSVLTSRPANENKPHASAIANKHQEQAWRKTKVSPMKRMGKENSWPTSPVKSAPSSPFPLLSSPAKCRLKEKRTFSPKKSREERLSTETAGETLAALFTQDSEGFFVIAHRDQHLKSPIKDTDYDNSQSVDTEGDGSDLEPEMLFTQDSEGNMVIKH